jgi:DNA-binding SARP family transcriptional activator
LAFRRSGHRRSNDELTPFFPESRGQSRFREVHGVTTSPIQRGASVRNRLPAGWSEGAHADRHARDIRLVTLGNFSVSACGVPVTLGHHQARVLLAILVCQTGPVHRDKLLEWMWPHLSADRALSTLYSTVYTLRRRLAPGRTGASSASFIRSDGEAYNLAWQRDDFLDATEFLRLSRIAGQPADGETRLRRLANAEAAYSGPFLPQWPYEEWAAVRRSEVEETYRTIAGDLAAALAETGQTSAAISLYRRLLAVDPERESWHRALMEIFIAQGERPMAVHQFELCRRTLVVRFGIGPSPETEALRASLSKPAARVQPSRLADVPVIAGRLPRRHWAQWEP